MNTPRHLSIFLSLCALAPAVSHAAQYHLESNRIAADSNDTGLTRMGLNSEVAPLKDNTDAWGCP